MYYLVGCAVLITGIYYYRTELGMKLLLTANQAIKSYHRFTSMYTKDNKEEKEVTKRKKTKKKRRSRTRCCQACRVAHL